MVHEKRQNGSMMEKGESQKGPYNIVAWHRMFFHCLGASTKNMRILQAQKCCRNERATWIRYSGQINNKDQTWLYNSYVYIYIYIAVGHTVCISLHMYLHVNVYIYIYLSHHFLYILLHVFLYSLACGLFRPRIALQSFNAWHKVKVFSRAWAVKTNNDIGE